MNYIFDIGKVFLDFEPLEFLRRRYDEETAQAVYGMMFGPVWDRLDAGDLLPENAPDAFCPVDHPLRPAVDDTYARWEDILVPMEDTIRFAQRLRGQGRRLFYLTNFQKGFEDIARRKGIFHLFSGGVVSSTERLMKPDPRIYRLLLNRYGLTAADCVFFDDRQENVDAACALGIKGIVFTDAAQAEKELHELTRRD